MLLKSVKLRGYTGIKKGLGLDEISLDLNGKSGLIAIAGQNGAGKSTLLENLHPFRTLASRDGALQKHVFSRDAVKELVFEMGGHTYRTVVKIDCGTGNGSGKQEGYVYVDGSDVSETTGKVVEYDRYIEGLLGSWTLFSNSVFCAQGSKKLNDFRPAELKNLFAEFLRLDILQQYEDTSKQCVGIVSGKLADCEKQIDRIRDQIETIGDPAAEIRRLAMDKVTLNLGKQGAETRSKQLEAALEAARRQIQENEKIDIQLAGLRKQNSELRQTKMDAEGRYATEEEKLYGQILELEVECKAHRKTAEKSHQMATAELDKKKYTSEMRACQQDARESREREDAYRKEYDNVLRQMNDMREESEDRLAEIQREIEAAAKSTSEASERNREASAKLARAEHATESDPELVNLRQKYQFAKSRTAVLEQKDPDCVSTVCGLITDALDAQKAMPEYDWQYEERRSALIAEHQRASREAYEAADVLDELREREAVKRKTLEDTRATYQASIGSIREELARADKNIKEESQIYRNLVSSVEAAQRKINECDEILAAKPEIDKAVNRIAVIEAEVAGLSRQIDEAKRIRIETVNATSAKIDALISEIAALEAGKDPGAPVRAADLEANIKAERAATVDCERQIAEIDTRIAGLEKEAERKERLQSELTELEERKKYLTRQSSGWIYLKNATGKNGLQALEIDSAAPAITGFANDLLRTAFGPLATLDFRTLDDEGRETIEIRVIDEDGESVLLDNRSGGQKVWALKALMLSMTMLSKEKSGRAFEAFFSDEEDGALDVDHSQKFVQLYRAMMRESGFRQGFFISHTPPCVAMADHVIEFGKGRVEVV